MRVVRLHEDREVASFADRARRHFDNGLKLCSFHEPWTEDLAEGCLLALQWNDNTICVVRVASEPLIFDTRHLLKERDAGNLLDDPPSNPI